MLEKWVIIGQAASECKHIHKKRKVERIWHQNTGVSWERTPELYLESWHSFPRLHHAWLQKSPFLSPWPLSPCMSDIWISHYRFSIKIKVAVMFSLSSRLCTQLMPLRSNNSVVKWLKAQYNRDHRIKRK